MAVDSLESQGSSDHSSMSSSSKGYDLGLFVEDPPSSLLCPVCKLTLRDPHLLSCCGAHICEVCIAPYKSLNQCCPSCEDEDYATLLNKQMKRRVGELKARCSNEGCYWTGELNVLSAHLEKCEYALKMCKHGCGEYVPQKNLLQHEKHECTKRPISLQIESLKFSFTQKLQSVQEAHDSEIKKLNKRLVEQELKLQEEIATLRQEVHSLKRVASSQQQQAHTPPTTPPPSSPSNHQFLPEWCYPLPVSTYVQPPCIFVMHNFSKHKKKDDHWFSQPFYTHQNGYKLCLRVNANGDGDGKGIFISLFVYVMKGEYDDLLNWPFYGELTLQLLNWREDRNHIEKTLPLDESVPEEYNGRQLKYSRGKGWGYQKFVAIDKLPRNISANTQFLKDDKICLRIFKAIVKQQ